MPHLAGWCAGLLLLLVLMLLLKPYIALVALYCCIVALYSFILIQFNPYIALVALYCCIVALYSFIRAQLKPHIALAALYFCIIAPYSFILAQYGSCGSILRNCNIISHHSGPIWPHCGPICCLAGWLAACLAAWLAAWLPGWLPLRPPSPPQPPQTPPGRPPQIGSLSIRALFLFKVNCKKGKKKNLASGEPGAPQITPKSTPNTIQKTHKFPIESLKKTLPEAPPRITLKTQLFTINPMQYSIFHVFKPLFKRCIFI